MSTTRTATMSRRASRQGWRYRGAVAARVLAAVVGGYYLAHGATAFLTLVLPLARVDRVIAASLLSFAVWCAAAIHAFAARSAWRAWWVPGLFASVLLGATMLFPELARRP
ncbi:hypothetical protein [Marilutibacter chinensis]|uniref:DUF3649 domain-containing protein n=1 Tax=Marilutibacter chinensis TaxID=2912247 RepID=A0ABS9HNY5_9GAMM|nr:hypothetical protein [Lysobacter chinensis]MCF7220694.1 hypothetical protein [Lysobacter chinensis]